jgi:hypothetical protein
MARSKSPSRRTAGKKTAKTRKRRIAAKKASTTRKRRATAKKAATPRKRRVAGKKAAVARKTMARGVSEPKAVASPSTAEIDQRIAIVRNNLRDLMEQASATSGSASEELLSDRIASQEAELRRLNQERDSLAKGKGG